MSAKVLVMSNSLVKQERLRARVWSIRKDSGRFTSRLTTPTHVGAFLMRRDSHGAGRVSIMVTRTELQDSLHRLSNAIECQLADIFTGLLAESRPDDASEIAYTACNLIEKLRCARDGDGGAA